MELNYPDYPCVALLGRTRQKPQGETERFGDEVMYFPISSTVDLEHVQQVRDLKGFSVVGLANLEQIEKRSKYKAGEVATIRTRLEAMANPPEMKRQMAEKDAKIAELQAKLASVAEKSNAKVIDAAAVDTAEVVEAKASKKAKSAVA